MSLYDLEIDELKAELEIVNGYIEDLKRIELIRGLTKEEINKENKCRFWYMEIKQKLRDKEDEFR